MATSYTKAFDALLSTTIESYKKKMYDNIFKDAVLLRILHGRGKRTIKGGERIIVPLMYGKNSTVTSVAGYDVISTTPQEGMTVAYSTWRTIAGSMVISDDEKSDNSGEAKILSLVEAKLKQTEMTMREEVNTQILNKFSAGNGGKDLDPLPLLVRYNVTASATIMGIDQSVAANSWWRNQTADSGATTYKGLLTDMKHMYNLCSKGGGGSPNLVLCEQIAYETYDQALQDINRITQTKKADVGYDSLNFKNAEVVWDELVVDAKNASTTITDSTAYFLNTDYIEFTVQDGRDFRVSEVQRPENQLCDVRLFDIRANLVISNRRKLGVLGGISTSIVS